MTLYRFWILGTGLLSVYVPIESILEEKGMIYTQQKSKNFGFFLSKKVNF